MSETTITAPDEPKQKKKKLKIEQVLQSSLIAGIKMAPKLPILRAAVMARLGQPIPDDKLTTDEIFEWAISVAKPSSMIKSQGVAFEQKVCVSETEFGRCNYSVGRYGEQFYELETDFIDGLLELLSAGEINWNGMINECCTKLKDLACDDSPELDYGDYDYDDHESTDSDNFEVDISRASLKTNLIAFIRTQRPDFAGLIES